MSWKRSKTSGWAAFDLQQKQKENIGAQPSNDPFPSLPSSVTSLQPSKTFSRNNYPYVKPSVIIHSVDFPSTIDYKKSEPSKVGSSAGLQGGEILRGNEFVWVFRQLKECYNWADDVLIEDIMASVNNDFNQASLLLKAMDSDECLEKNKDNMVHESSCDFEKLVSNDTTFARKRDDSSGKISEPSKSFFVLDSLVGKNNEDMKDEVTFDAGKLSDGCMDINSMLGESMYVLSEPEWEEVDLYSSCRKDAIKRMRSAARHSKSATESFLRCDHFAAQQFSLKAREEWVAAKRLNEEAAREILSIQNKNNGLCRLDLHGLHVAEAIQALEERLRTIEAQVLFKSSSSSLLPNSFMSKAMALNSFSGGHIISEGSDEYTFSGLTPFFLEVITGIGKHSRGGAALPTAVKTFLGDNGYIFDETRQGVIMVRPKFRHV